VADSKQRAAGELRKSGFAGGRRRTDSLDFPTDSLGQNCPQQNPPLPDQVDALGDALTIREAAALIGCSVWTVRQRCMRQGLPHYRPSKSGRLIFYRNQVVRWLIEKQTERRW
jgi:hypothetical protein